MNEITSNTSWVDAQRRDLFVRWNSWISVGATMAALAVMSGALAAHGLHYYLAEKYPSGETRDVDGRTVPAAQKYLDDFKTASRYQMYHALGLIAIGVLASIGSRRLLTAAAWCHFAGIVMFCGGLYYLSLMADVMSAAARHKVGVMAACGGAAFIVGWCLLAVAVYPYRAKPAESERGASAAE